MNKSSTLFKNIYLFLGSVLLLLGFSSKLQAQTYCTPPAPTYNDLYWIDDVTTTGALSDISNLGTGFGGTGYTDYSSTHTAVTFPGGDFDFTVASRNGASPGIKIWIDWNQNGTFEASELVYSSTAGSTSAVNTYTGNIQVPANAVYGTTKMRIRNYSNQEPCNQLSYGETEDYGIIVQSLSDCSDANAGVISTSETQVCADENFTLSTVGATSPGNGLVYQWQSSPAGANTWSDIPNANSMNYTGTGVNGDTDFRLKVTCSFGSLEDISNVVTVTESPANLCYCTPPPPTYTTLYWIENVITTGALSNISNLGTGFGGAGYTDYSGAHSVTTFPGGDFDFEVQSQNGASAGLKIWVDWNQNGVFETNELVYSSTAGSSSTLNTYAGNIVVPVNAVVGTTKMRIRNYTGQEPCNQISYGETEDYGVVVQSLNDCTDAIAGTISSNKTEVCPDENFTLSTVGASSPGSGLVYQWQSSPAGQNTWINIAGATSLNYTGMGVNGETDFRLKVTCSFGSLEDISNVVTIDETPSVQCYCTPNTASTSYFIDSFAISGAMQNINNGATGMGPGGYQDFTGSDTVKQMQTQDVSVYIKGNSTLTAGAKVWVDWNKNGVFDANELVFSTSTYSNIHQGSFTVPITAVAGYTRMRVGWHGTSTTGPTDPCQNSMNGEFEDYTFEVMPLPSCATLSTPAGWEVYVDRDTICELGDITISISEPVLGSDVTYQFQSSTDGVTWTNIGTASTNQTIQALNVNQITQFRAQWLCNGLNVGNSAPATVYVFDEPEILSVNDGTNCGPGTVTLSATGTSGAELQWFDDINSSIPIHTGPTFTTPIINATTPYYVTANVGAVGVSENYVGSGTNTLSTTPQPFHTLYWGNKNQYLIHASELVAAGYAPGMITELYFDVIAANGMAMSNFEIKMKNTTSTALTATYETGMTSVYNNTTSAETLVANTEKVFVLTQPFFWDGSNLIVETCFNNSSYQSGHSVRSSALSFNASTYQYGDNANVCSQTNGYTSLNRPNMKFTIEGGCSSDKEEVMAIIQAEPQVNLGGDLAACLGHTFTLDAGPGFDSYLWSDNSTGQTLDVTTPGTYSVQVGLGDCYATDYVNVGFYDAPVPVLDSIVYACDGEAVELDAGNPGSGTSYLWSTGATTRVIYVTQSGNYTVSIDNGACAITDEIEVVIIPQATGESIHNTDLGDRTFQLHVVNPVNAQSYLWDFGDGTTSTDAEPIHQFPDYGTYEVTVFLNQADCNDGDSLMRFIVVKPVGIDDIVKSDGQLKMYPNPATDLVNIEMKDELKMNAITVQDITGRVITEHYFDQSVAYYNLSTKALTSGIYQVIIHTDEGRFVRKLEIIK